MNKTLALDPKAISIALDWHKVYPFLGQKHGLFLAKYPKKWVDEFVASIEATDMSEWGFWDLQKLQAYLVELEGQNALISLNSPFDREEGWFRNFSNIPEEKRRNCIAFGARNDPDSPPTLDNLDPEELRVNTTLSGRLHPSDLVKHLSPYLRSSEIVAIVDRYAKLINSNENESLFSTFLRCLVEELQTQGSRCHEILVYAEASDRLDSEDSLQEQLAKSLNGLKSPSEGVHLIFCDEKDKSRGTDLHARKIITKHVAFSLADSIGGGSHSKSITRIPDSDFVEENIRYWIDGDHGLTVKLKASWRSA